MRKVLESQDSVSHRIVEANKDLSGEYVDVMHAAVTFLGMLITARRSRQVPVLVCSALMMLACQGEKASRATQTPVRTSGPTISALPNDSSARTWDSRVGTFFAVPAPGGESAYLVYPQYTSEISIDSVNFDLRSNLGAEIELIRDGRSVGTAHVAELKVEKVEDCPIWPMARLTAAPGALPLPADWGVGLLPHTPSLPIEYLATLNAKDSTQLTVAVARLASAVPGDTSVAFRGRPFVVRQVARIGTGAEQFLVAEVIRTIDQEAMPLQEHLMIIADADSIDRTGYRVDYFERSIGNEDVVETTELLAAVPLEGSQVLILVARELGEGASYATLRRSLKGTWHLEWASAYAGC